MTRESFEDGLLVTLDEHIRGHDASEPLPAELEKDDELLSDEEFDLLTPEEQDTYLQLLGVKLGKKWTLEGSPKQMLANALAQKLDYIYYGGAAGGGSTGNAGRGGNASTTGACVVRKSSSDGPGRRFIALPVRA